MKMFISWSTPHAQAVAEALRKWLKDMIHAIDPFVSSMDIAKGERGLAVIARELEGTSHGIICVNRANQNAPWLNFEAGSISKQVEKSRVFPVLIDLPGSDLQGPLREFQYTELFIEREMLRLAESIWETCPESNISLDHLQRNFHRLWPELMETLKPVRETPSMTEPVPPPGGRTAEDKLDELLGLARQNQRRIDSLEAARMFPPPSRLIGDRPFPSDFERTFNRGELGEIAQDISEKLEEEVGRPVEVRTIRPNQLLAYIPRGTRLNLDATRALVNYTARKGARLRYVKPPAEDDGELDES
ncbi:toll/interleukin-1 receptor domain-containing protein [Streptomyces hydrogenans]|uniref:toll/interleukin-1 receptor domain-containing protein n=1 Tax=Streptomyces hydrogenans TaxID=1873719 RepID=UPI0035D7C246